MLVYSAAEMNRVEVFPFPPKRGSPLGLRGGRTEIFDNIGRQHLLEDRRRDTCPSKTVRHCFSGILTFFASIVETRCPSPDVLPGGISCSYRSIRRSNPRPAHPRKWALDPIEHYDADSCLDEMSTSNISRHAFRTGWWERNSRGFSYPQEPSARGAPLRDGSNSMWA